VPQPAKTSRLVLMIRAMITVVVCAVLRTVVMRPVGMVATLMAVPVVVTAARAVRLAHASILRDEIRFRTSTTTRTAHLRNERNNHPDPI